MYAGSECGRFDSKENALKHRDELVKRHPEWYCVEGTYVEEMDGWRTEISPSETLDYIREAVRILREQQEEIVRLKKEVSENYMWIEYYDAAAVREEEYLGD
jgi:hypothetical protein